MALSGGRGPSRAALLLATVCVLGGAPPAGARSALYAQPEPAEPSSGKELRGLFSPRMDYDEWTPLGRGDPLKNDPTYDYVPPVLERVHYWIDPSSRTPDPPALSAPSRPPPRPPARPPARPPPRPPAREPLPGADGPAPAALARRDAHAPFLKFVDGPKFSSEHQFYSHHVHHHHRHSSEAVSLQQRKPHIPVSNSFSNSHSYLQNANKNAAAPSLTETQAFLSSKKPSTVSVESTYSLNSEGMSQNQQEGLPVTILVPPPLQTSDLFSISEYHASTDELSTIPPIQRMPYHTPSATRPSVTVQEGNLILQTTMSEWEEGKTQLATIAQASNYVTWRTPTPVPEGKIKTTNVPSYIENQVQFNVNEDKSNHKSQIGLLHSILQNERVQSALEQHHDIPTTTLATTVTSAEVTSTSSSLTTDPLFSHYKQPAEPLRGPMYLIIQGHSKVKTYGANKHQNSFHGIPIQVSNEIQYQDSEGNETVRTGRELDYGNAEDSKWIYAAERKDDGLNIEQLTEETVTTARKLKNGVNSVFTKDALFLRAETLNEKEDQHNETGEMNVKVTSKTYSDTTRNPRRKRQIALEDFIPIDDDRADEILHEFLVQQGQGSGVGALIASSLVSIGKRQTVTEERKSPRET